MAAKPAVGSWRLTVSADRWDRCGRKPEKVINEIRRACREQNIPLYERQNGGSHWVGQTPTANVVVPVHGEIPKGTWRSILKMLAAIGLAVLFVYIVL